MKALLLLNSVCRKLLEQVLGFLYFIFKIVPLARSFIRVPYDQLRICNSDSSRIFFSWSPLGPLRDMLFSKSFVLPWFSGVSQRPLSCFVDVTPLRVAGISGKGCFCRSLGSETPIFKAELCAAMSGIFYHFPYSNYIKLIDDNLGVLFII